MFSFFKKEKEKSLEDIFIETLKNSDIKWEIYYDSDYPSIKIEGGGFYFEKFYSNYWKGSRGGTPISSKLFYSVLELAKESIMQDDIKKA